MQCAGIWLETTPSLMLGFLWCWFPLSLDQIHVHPRYPGHDGRVGKQTAFFHAQKYFGACGQESGFGRKKIIVGSREWKGENRVGNLLNCILFFVGLWALPYYFYRLDRSRLGPASLSPFPLYTITAFSCHFLCNSISGGRDAIIFFLFRLRLARWRNFESPCYFVLMDGVACQ